MDNYKEMYLELFRAITEANQKIGEAVLILHKAQLDSESMYLNNEEETD